MGAERHHAHLLLDHAAPSGSAAADRQCIRPGRRAINIDGSNTHIARRVILDGAEQIALPAFVSTLCICIVFVPMFFLTGAAHFLFVPLAKAVVFAMLASYVLSRTLVPTLVMWFYRNVELAGEQASAAAPRLARPFIAIQRRFESGFSRFRDCPKSMRRRLPDYADPTTSGSPHNSARKTEIRPAP